MIDSDGQTASQDEYPWLIETSDDGATWWHESHPVHGDENAGGIEQASGAEDLARRVLIRRFAALRGDTTYDWEELWFRVTVWDYRHAVDHSGPHQPPHLPDRAGTDPRSYGRHLRVNGAEPHAVEVRTPRQTRALVWSGAPAEGSMITGGISRTELDQVLSELTGLIDQARECGWDTDPTGEYRTLGAARAVLATLDLQLADRARELDAAAAQKSVSRTRSGR
ncbi:MAG: hypothetical protein ACT4NY_01995 [Pseudonocardiales bacterium]